MDISNSNTYKTYDHGISLFKTFNCGQSFRINTLDENTFEGVALGRYLSIHQENGFIYIENCDDIIYNQVWKKYLGLDLDYNKIDNSFTSSPNFDLALSFSKGIRILKQDKFETIISFIISQNNNIPRIKKIINLLCENFGDKIEENNHIYYTFPSVEVINNLSLEDLSVIKAGFRAKYILDAADKIKNNIVNINYINTLTYDMAKEELKKIKGIGNKVADCVLLFGFSYYNAFPKDVWINRIMDLLFNGEDGEKLFGEFAGIAQQYLFYYAHENKI